MNNRWTTEEDQTIAKGIARGLCYEDIAALLPKRSAKAIEMRVSRNRRAALPAEKRVITKRKWTEEEDIKLALMVESGTAWSAIASRLARSMEGCKQRARIIGTAEEPPEDVRPVPKVSGDDSLFRMWERAMDGVC